MKRISKQKMYEMAIMKTYEYACCDQVSKEMELIKTLPDTFEELMLKRDILGFKNNIPSKHPFDKMGFKYVIQLIGMTYAIKDFEFSCNVFDFIESHTKLFDFNSQEQFDELYDLFYEAITTDRTFCGKISTFMIKHYNKELNYFDKFVSLVYNLSIPCDIDFVELVKLKNAVSK